MCGSAIATGLGRRQRQFLIISDSADNSVIDRPEATALAMALLVLLAKSLFQRSKSHGQRTTRLRPAGEHKRAGSPEGPGKDSGRTWFRPIRNCSAVRYTAKLLLRTRSEMDSGVCCKAWICRCRVTAFPFTPGRFREGFGCRPCPFLIRLDGAGFLRK
jgi:hypothetical protein